MTDANAARLLGEFQRAAAALPDELRNVFHDAAEDVKKGWQDNLRAAAPRHLPHAPKSITTETRARAGLVESEIGPQSGRPQANLVLGDEFGSRNQAPHLSGQRALDPAATALARQAEAKIMDLLP